MEAFWSYAKGVLRYKRRLCLAAFGALLDALCMFAGFGSLLWVVRQLFDPEKPMKQIIAEKIGDQTLSGWVSLVPDDPFLAIGAIFGFILFMAILGSFGRYLHQYSSFSIALRTITRIRAHAYRRLIVAPMSVVLADGRTDLLSRVVQDTGTLFRGINTLLGKTARQLLATLAYILVAFWVDWFLAALFLLATPILFCVVRKFGKIIFRAGHRAMQQQGQMLLHGSEAINALATVKVNQAESYEKRRFNRSSREVMRELMRSRSARALGPPIVEVLTIASVMLVGMVAAWWVFYEGRHPANLVLVLMSLAMASTNLKPLVGFHNDVQESAAAAERVREVLQLARESRYGRGPVGRRLRRHSESVAFENVSFVYPNAHDPALQDVNLQVSHGQTCAIVGTNGSGKTTLLNLLPRLFEPTIGHVLIDGVDLRACSMRSVRGQIAMVRQQTDLFDGTIADNIRYGRLHATQKQLIEAARIAQAEDFILDLPNGYETRVGEGGQRLSGGQRQRIALARAVLRDPALLILDEATSQVDPDSEAKINAALDAVTEGRTTFIIAQRLETVRRADVIVVMDSGRIMDTGSHEVLMAECRIYRLLCQTQLSQRSEATF
ncbi:MAG: ABC transporter ATP-binding protein [Phycisphaeraceae bacterium]|nr:ABC transporter ATP-binding protein [Phycisphaeraceae bacterium]